MSAPQAKPTHGDGHGSTWALEPQRCQVCDTALIVVEIAATDGLTTERWDEVQCPMGHVACV